MRDSGLYAAPRLVETAEDCHFYHAMDIPGHGFVSGEWDLRGHEDEYLGNIGFDGSRVLEVGPASGFLTFHMERRGASVVAVDLPAAQHWDMVPHAGLDDDATRDWQTAMRQMHNGFWFAHRQYTSRVRVHYGDVYALPPEIGQFDISVLAAVLLHLRDPLAVIEQCARMSNRVVITEIHAAELDGQPVQRLFATRDFPQWHTWWRFSPELFVQFFEVVGFDTIAVTFHEQTHVSDGVEYAMPMMTIVAERA